MWRIDLLSPLLARRRWEHLAFRLIHETLPSLRRAAGSLALTVARQFPLERFPASGECELIEVSPGCYS